MTICDQLSVRDEAIYQLKQKIGTLATHTENMVRTIKVLREENRHLKNQLLVKVEIKEEVKDEPSLSQLTDPGMSSHPPSCTHRNNQVFLYSHECGDNVHHGHYIVVSTVIHTRVHSHVHVNAHGLSPSHTHTHTHMQIHTNIYVHAHLQYQRSRKNCLQFG